MIGHRAIAAAIKRNTAKPPHKIWWGTVTAVNVGPPPNLGVTINGSSTPINALISNSYGQYLPVVNDTVFGFNDDKGDHWVFDRMAVQIPSWSALTLTNSWANVGSPYANAAYRLEGNIVRLGGLIHSGTSGTSPFTLPAGARPTWWTVLASANSAISSAVLVIATTGVATASFGGSLSSFVLDGLQYPIR